MLWATTLIAGTLVLLPQPAARPAPAPVDPRITWLRDHAISVRTIDEPALDQPEDFSDLEPLRAMIGSARVVGLGEQSHGDGATFKAKCRLVRFLHQQMGFDVLAWESGLFDCRRVDELFAAGVAPADAATIAEQHGVFGIWAQSAQAKPVLEYAARTQKTDRRLIMAGFDNQYTSSASRRQHASWLDSFFTRLADRGCKLPEPVVSSGVDAVRWMAARLRETGAAPRGDPDRLAESRAAVRALITLIEDQRAYLARHEEPREIEFARLTLLNLLTFDRASRETDRQNISNTPREVLQLRDQRMGENLVFLAREYFKGKRLIVWAASSHLLRNGGECTSLYGPENRGGDFKPLGHFAAEGLGRDYFVITFSAHQGAIGRPWSAPTPIARSEPGDLEALMADAGLSLAIVPLNPAADDPEAAWLREPQVMRPMGYGRERAVWGRCFDALFFTRDMTPSTR
ncbi:MAG: erythromycin esterase family protein [Phycisphaerales bacterium]